MHIVSDYYDTLADAGRIIRKYKDRGFRCVIGSGLVCEEASAMGLKSIFVYPQESLCSFIQLAYDTAVSICKELEVKQQMSTIFQYSQTGLWS